MKVARLGNKLIPLNAYREEYRGRLSCRFCNARVDFVHEHNQSRKNIVVFVPRYYRLGRGAQHNDSCPLNFDRQKMLIVARVADKRLVSRSGEKLIVRILIRDKKEGREDGFADLLFPHVQGREPVFLHKDVKVAYISSILKIVRLRSYLADKDEMRQHVFLQVPNMKGQLQPVEWSNFCFEGDDFIRLYELISDGNLNHAICIFGDARVKKDPRGREVIQIEHKVGNQRYIFECPISIEMFDRIHKSDMQACIYLWRYSTRQPKKWNDIIYHNINGSFLSDNQILLFNDDLNGK